MSDSTEPPHLTGWVDAPSADAGISILGSGGWVTRSYAELAAGAREVTSRLESELQCGPVCDDPACVVVLEGSTSFDLVSTYYGTLRVGHQACILPPRAAYRSAKLHQSDVRARLSKLRPVLTLSDDDVLRSLVDERRADRAGDVPANRRRRRGGIVQFTSGSTGEPTAIPLSLEAMASNVAMIGKWLALDSSETAASWLPLYHDMGLHGFLTTPVAHQMHLRLMTPQTFMRRPLLWLECFSNGAAIGGAPPFALDHIVGWIERYGLPDLDLSRWRALIVGAERLSADALRRFATALAPVGFQATSVLPAYGLAEATLAVTTTSLGAGTTLLPTSSALSWGAHVNDSSTETDTELVGCGRALPGVTIGIVDEFGAPVADGTVGEITVRGPSLADVSRSDGDVLLTGDAGLVQDGELYVLGRIGNLIKANGRGIPCESLEIRLRALTNIPDRCAVLGDPFSEGKILVVAEDRATSTSWAPGVLDVVRSEAGSGSAIDVIRVPRGFMLYTTSGKPQRRSILVRLLEDGGRAEVVASSAGGSVL